MTKIAEKKFYTCKYDAAFKEIFMNEKNKDLLKCLLKSIVNQNIKIKSYLNLEQNMNNVHIKRQHLDLIVEIDKGEILIEVNTSPAEVYSFRNLMFFCHRISSFIERGKEYDRNVQFIQLNFTYGRSTNQKRLYNKHFLGGFKNLSIYEFNMAKYSKIWYDKDKKLINKYKYIIMLNLNRKELEELLNITKNDRMVKKYMNEAIRVNSDPKLMEYISAKDDNEMLQRALIKEATEDGIQRGISQGERRAIIRTAISLLKKGFSVKDISECTGLSIKEIKNLELDSK